MEIAHTVTQSRRFTPAYLALIVLIACLLLFSLDHETTSFWVLFKTSNLMALLLYFLPTWSLTLVFLHLSEKYRPSKSHLLFSSLIGIPLGFTVVMLSLWAIMT
jgi:amino acid transporter